MSELGATMKAGDEVRFRDPHATRTRTKGLPSNGIIVAAHQSPGEPWRFDVFFMGSLVLRNVPSNEFEPA